MLKPLSYINNTCPIHLHSSPEKHDIRPGQKKTSLLSKVINRNGNWCSALITHLHTHKQTNTGNRQNKVLHAVLLCAVELKYTTSSIFHFFVPPGRTVVGILFQHTHSPLDDLEVNFAPNCFVDCCHFFFLSSGTSVVDSFQVEAFELLEAQDEN